MVIIIIYPSTSFHIGGVHYLRKYNYEINFKIKKYIYLARNSCINRKKKQNNGFLKF